jgi:hypothetical protein
MRHVETCLIAACSTLLMACGSNSNEPASEEEEDPAVHACEMVGSPGTAIDAAEERDMAPSLVVDEQPYTVALPRMKDGYLELLGPMDALLFAAPANIVTGLFEASGTVNLLPTASPNDRCPTQIPEHWDLELTTADRFHLKLGPAAVDSVWLMLTDAADHGH